METKVIEKLTEEDLEELQRKDFARNIEVRSEVREILHSRFKELDSELSSFTIPNITDSDMKIIGIMAEIGKAILLE